MRPRFWPFLRFWPLHEFETILLCESDYFELEYEHADAGITALKRAVTEASSPELVDDGEVTAPSKRIIAQFPQYRGEETIVGVALAACVGLDSTRRLCPHFDRWLTQLEALGNPTASTSPQAP